MKTTPATEQANPGSISIESRTGEVDGLKLHYLAAGRGPVVIHGCSGEFSLNLRTQAFSTA